MKANYREKPRDTRVEATRIHPLSPSRVFVTMAGPAEFGPGMWLVKTRENGMLLPPMTDEQFQALFEPIPQAEQDAETLPPDNPPGEIKFEMPAGPRIVAPQAAHGSKLVQ